ncbi:MAG: metal ABC transporter permease [Verrucomicrobiae bacterium]|nr:metal ABC transporter permease [Verrucomicrobiae bacterium]
MNWSAPFQFEFMRTALAVGLVIGTVCAVLSCFLVLKGWSLMGDAISHAVLPGIVLAYIAGLPIALGAFASALVCTIGTGFIKSHSRVKEDTVLGVVFTGMFALGLVLFTRVESDQHLNHILFGSLLGLPRNQVVETAGIGLAALLLTWILRKDLLLFCFDPGHLRTIGRNPQVMNYVLLILLSLTIVTSLKAVGILLVVAMLVTPGCVGLLLADRFPRVMAIAVATAVMATTVGTYVSFFLNASTGACIVLAQSTLFVLALLLAPKRGLLAARGRSAAAPAGRAAEADPAASR